MRSCLFSRGREDRVTGRTTGLGDRAVGVLAVLVIVLMGAIVLQVLCNALDINPLLSFGAAVPFLGKGITLNTLLDLQWHLLVIMGLLGAGAVWNADGHVRVDFLYRARPARTRARIDLIGNLIFAAPFLVMILPAAWDFAARAWTSGEGSRNGGLNDLWDTRASV